MASVLVWAYVTLWLIVVGFFRWHRIWLLYYLVGSVGMALGIIFVSRWVLPIELLMEKTVASTTASISSLMGLETQVFDSVPGLMMVMIITQPIGWTALHVTVECSGLLESAVFIGMLAFYPGWPWRQKLVLLAIGLVLTFIANIIRLLLIIGTLHWIGKDALYISHTVVGRTVFFVLVIAIYWYVLTVPTLNTVRRKLATEMQR